MKRAEIAELLTQTLKDIQARSGREVPEITDETKPLRDLEGFDSHNDVELTVELGERFALDDKTRLCVSDEGTRFLSIREIVGKVADHLAGQKESTNA